MESSRRNFLKNSGFMAAGFFGLQRLSRATSSLTLPPMDPSVTSQIPMRQIRAYGPPLPDPRKIFDLPKGFHYTVLARKGEPMDDGLLVPGDQDGMAAFELPDGRLALVCNHELSFSEVDDGPFGPNNERLTPAFRASMYDYGRGMAPHQGGTSTLIVNPRTREKELHYLSLAETSRNCAGGPTPWGSWITCEETNEIANDINERDHGYNFEVPAVAEIRPAPPNPLKAMGRFRHEAVAVDPRTGIVYQTEDMGDGLIYRYIPEVKGELARGGRLQALALIDEPSRDTRNWPENDQEVFLPNRFVDVRWIDIEDPESPGDTLRFQGYEKGAARFARGEGMWYGNGEIYFACTNGGSIQKGQVFRYIPSLFEGTAREAEKPGQLELFVESSDKDILKNCDNLTIAPWGDLFICEDSDQPCKLVGVTPDGSFFEFGSNPHNSSELAGACFSPGGETLFVNIQGPGITLAITGPWNKNLVG